MHDIVKISPECYWQPDDQKLQNCFLAKLEEDIIIITFNNFNNISVMEVKRLIKGSSEISQAEYEYKFSSMVKIVAVSLVHDDHNPWLAVMYHNNETNKCCITRLAIASSV